MKSIIFIGLLLVLTNCLHFQAEQVTNTSNVDSSSPPPEQPEPVKLIFVDSSDQEVQKLAPTKEQYEIQHNETSSAANQTEHLTLASQNHEQCGQIVDLIFDIADLLIESTVGDVSTCGYGLRVSSVFGISQGPSLTVVSQYLDSGVRQKQFYPSTLQTKQFGGGIYRKTSGSATGANGIVRFRIGNENNFLVAFFENSWSSWYLATVCLQGGVDSSHDSDSEIYNLIYSGSKKYVGLYSNFWVSSRLVCSGFDMYVKKTAQYTFDAWGHRATIKTQYTQNSISSAQTCKLLTVNAILEY